MSASVDMGFGRVIDVLKYLEHGNRSQDARTTRGMPCQRAQGSRFPGICHPRFATESLWESGQRYPLQPHLNPPHFQPTAAEPRPKILGHICGSLTAQELDAIAGKPPLLQHCPVFHGIPGSGTESSEPGGMTALLHVYESVFRSGQGIEPKL